MTADNLNVYMPVLILVGFAIGFFVIAQVVSRLISPTVKTKYKATAYECGEMPVGNAWSGFNVRFYVVGLIFIIFDVESVLMFPAAAVFNQFKAAGDGGAVLIVFLLFISVLVEGIVYCWKKGDLDWVRSFQNPDKKS